ncbi:MAG: NADH-quinone oxidoreductase subunit NuoH [Anaerolineales bacterium]
MEFNWFLLLEWVLKSFILSLILLGGFAYLTWFERRVLARMQVRLGPNRVGWQGLLQPIADAIKLIFKEEFTPASAQKFLFFLAPILTVVPALIIVAVLPWGPDIRIGDFTLRLYIADINVGILYITAIASVAIYGITLAGWASNNKYALMGGLRSTAQMISYELSLGFCFVLVILLGNSMNMIDIVEAQRDVWFAVLQPVGALVFLIIALAELNRAPFDMPEAEQELAAGYHTEYSGMKFALFFMAEYTKMITLSAISATLFFGGYREFWFLKDTFLSVDVTPLLGPVYLVLKIVVLLFGMVWVRATLPRIRYDRLMVFGWKVLLPLTLFLVFITSIGVVFGDVYGPLAVWLIIPVPSLLVGWFFTLAVDRSLRRKMYA